MLLWLSLVMSRGGRGLICKRPFRRILGGIHMFIAIRVRILILIYSLTVKMVVLAGMERMRIFHTADDILPVLRSK